MITTTNSSITKKVSFMRRYYWNVMSYVRRRLRLIKFNVKLISYDDLVHISSGSYGSYYRFVKNPNIGIKVLSSYAKAKEELEMLRKAYVKSPDLFPSPGELIFVKTHEQYGYSMEHIPYGTLTSVRRQYLQLNTDTIIAQIEQVLHSLGIHHNDLHKSNVLYDVNTGNFKVIDVSPDFFVIVDDDNISAEELMDVAM